MLRGGEFQEISSPAELTRRAAAHMARDVGIIFLKTT